jgi:hypothetical protein
MNISPNKIVTKMITHRATLISLNFLRLALGELAQYRSIDASTMKLVDNNADVTIMHVLK